MFAIYRRNVGGRVRDRYFKDYQNARKAIAEDVKRTKELAEEGGLDLKFETIDRMNVEKGFWEYEVRFTNLQGERVSYAIVDGHFEDEPNE